MKPVVAAVAFVALAACAAVPQKPVVQKETLYQSLGGRDGVDRLAAASVRRIFDDLRINLFFENGNPAESQRLVAELICQISGGPCEYTGRSMEETHSGMNLSDADFDAFLEDVAAAMDEIRVAPDARQRLLALFEAMRPQVVGQ